MAARISHARSVGVSGMQRTVAMSSLGVMQGKTLAMSARSESGT